MADLLFDRLGLNETSKSAINYYVQMLPNSTGGQLCNDTFPYTAKSLKLLLWKCKVQRMHLLQNTNIVRISLYNVSF